MRLLAVVDTSIILDLLDTTGAPAAENQRVLAELILNDLRRQNVRFIIPAPVIAELCQNGPGSEVVRRLTRTALRGLRVEVLDEDCADAAGAIARRVLPGTRGIERGAVKFDALIAGMAHHLNARWLVTSNARDFRRYLGVLKSPVQLLIPAEQPSPQQVMARMLVPGAHPPPPPAADTDESSE